MKVLELDIKAMNDFENQPYKLTPKQELELADAVEETYHAENLISHEEALQGLSRWLSK